MRVPFYYYGLFYNCNSNSNKLLNYFSNCRAKRMSLKKLPKPPWVSRLKARVSRNLSCRSRQPLRA
jgi:hypothetical protein